VVVQEFLELLVVQVVEVATKVALVVQEQLRRDLMQEQDQHHFLVVLAVVVLVVQVHLTLLRKRVVLAVLVFHLILQEHL
jgi:hypothetical protein